MACKNSKFSGNSLQEKSILSTSKFANDDLNILEPIHLTIQNIEVSPKKASRMSRKLKPSKKSQKLKKSRRKISTKKSSRKLKTKKNKSKRSLLANQQTFGQYDSNTETQKAENNMLFSFKKQSDLVKNLESCIDSVKKDLLDDTNPVSFNMKNLQETIQTMDK